MDLSLGASAMLLALLRQGIVGGRSGWAASPAALDRAMTREAHCPTDRVMKEPAREEATADQQHAGVDAHRAPGERCALVENPSERWTEAFGRVRQPHHRAARALDPGVVRGVRPVQVPVVRGLLGEDVRLEHSGPDDGDAQAERRDLLRKGLGPPFEGAFGGGVGADRWHAPDATLARYDDDPPTPGGPH